MGSVFAYTSLMEEKRMKKWSQILLGIIVIILTLPGLGRTAMCVNCTTQRFDAVGGNGSLVFTAVSNPIFTATDWSCNSDTDWIVFNSATSGTGNSVVYFTVLPNTTNCSRIGYIRVAGSFEFCQSWDDHNHMIKVIQEPMNQDSCLLPYGQDMQLLFAQANWQTGLRFVAERSLGLLWEVKSPSPNDINYQEDKYTLNQAVDIYIPSLNSVNYGGFNDWRLPTSSELAGSLWINQGSKCNLTSAGGQGLVFVDSGLCDNLAAYGQCEMEILVCLMEQRQGKFCDTSDCCPATVVAVRDYSPPLILAPDAPTGVFATAGNGQAAVYFSAPSSNGSAITSYMVTSNPGNITASGLSIPITVTGLSNGTSYIFTVTATNAVGTGPASEPTNSVTPTPSYEELQQQIDTQFGQHVTYPPYLADQSTFLSQVATIWDSWTSWATGVDYSDYENLYWTGFDYDSLSFNVLMRARDYLQQGDLVNAHQYLVKSLHYADLSNKSFSAAADVFDGNTASAQIFAQGIKDGSAASLKFAGFISGSGIAFAGVAEAADILDMSFSVASEALMNGPEAGYRELVEQVIVKIIFDEIDFGGQTLSDYLKNRIGASLFPFLSSALDNPLAKDVLSKAIKEAVTEFAEDQVEAFIDMFMDALKQNINYIHAQLHSPCELEVISPTGEVTGLANGAIMAQIPRSVYGKEGVTIAYPADAYIYKVKGIADGSYGLDITSMTDGVQLSFTATGIPISLNGIHKFEIDWELLSLGGKGVTVSVDKSGTGSHVTTFIAGSTLTEADFAAAETKTVCSILGNDPKPSILDQDIFRFQGTEGEEVTILLEAKPISAKKATLLLVDKITGALFLRADLSALPNQIKTKLPKTGEYLIIVSEQLNIPRGAAYRGDYCLTLKSRYETNDTLAPYKWVE